MKLFRKNTLIEVLSVLDNGDRKVQNQGDSTDIWIIPRKTFEDTYEEAPKISNNIITQYQVDKIFEESDKEVWSVFNKTFVLSVRLKNGFVITESASCVDPVNFNPDIGRSLCTDRIKNRIWELEGYMLQNEIAGVDNGTDQTI